MALSPYINRLIPHDKFATWPIRPTREIWADFYRLPAAGSIAERFSQGFAFSRPAAKEWPCLRGASYALAARLLPELRLGARPGPACFLRDLQRFQRPSSQIRAS